MSELLTNLSHWRPFTAIVVGDFMLDELVFGDADRMSPDAPAPVLLVKRRERAPGGAANVCLDLAALGGRIIAVGAVGDDEAGAYLRKALASEGINVDGLLTTTHRPTTIKRNLIGMAQHRHPQKMLRMDEESREPLSPDLAERISQVIASALAGADALCIEDYGKGVCTDDVCKKAIKSAKAVKTPVFVDPAMGVPASRYVGCDAITPNRTEAEALVGAPIDTNPTSTAARDAAALLLKRFDANAVAITLDKHGAALAQRTAGGAVLTSHATTRAREVYDVTGAGDMVLAALTAARANGFAWLDTLRFANAAAGLEVELFGVQPIPFERVHRALLHEEHARGSKLRTLEEALVEVAALRREGKRIVFTNGCFDILHAGHIALLRAARAFGDALIVGVNDDDSVRRLKGAGRPVHALADRVEILSELESVATVVPFSQDTPIPLIEAIRPDVLAKGADYSKKEVVGADLVECWGGCVELVPVLDGRSTSRAVERLAASASASQRKDA